MVLEESKYKDKLNTSPLPKDPTNEVERKVQKLPAKYETVPLKMDNGQICCEDVN
jgi:hypothetical protein